MVESRIPLAEFLAAAVILFCFVIALIMINAQAASRARAFGAWGVGMLFATMIMATLNGSLGSAYGTHSLIYTVGSVVVAVVAAAGLVLLALALVRAARARTSRGGR